MELENIKRRIYEEEREKKIKRIFSEEVPLVKEWRNKYSSYMAFFSNSKLFINKLKLKVIDKRLNCLITNLEAVRKLIEEEMQEEFKMKKITYRSDFKKAINVYFPFKYRVGVYRGEFLKVDIKSCFYSIYSKLGLDVTVISEIDNENKKIEIKAVGKGLLTKQNSWVIRELENEKELRNGVYGLTRSCWMLIFKPNGKVEKQYFRGKLQNLDLTIAIASLLHNFVNKFDKKILYWNIDGGIIWADVFEEMQRYLEELGLVLRKEVESQEVEILALGSYRIGDYETLHFKAGVTTDLKEKIYSYEIKNAEKIEKLLKRLKDE